MKKTNVLLSKGIKALRKSDEEIERLIAPRSEEIISLLDRYINEIKFFNPAYGLVGTNDKSELVIKHILDSLAPLGIISRLLASLRATNGEVEAARIADAGSGAGLPGIPLAIALKDCGFTLIERMVRRAGFLLNTTAVLELSNITVEEAELEEISLRSFNLVTFRAFMPLEPKLLKTLFSVLRTGGVIAAYKGRREKIEEEMLPLDAFIRDARGLWEAVPYKVPFLEEERHLLIIRTPEA